jgi:hypothetical protein
MCVAGTRLVSQAEFRNKQAELIAPEPAAKEPTPAGDKIPFIPIGYGKPLTIMIRDVYTGEYPHQGPFGGHGDVAVVSGVKNFDLFDASTRALNFLATAQNPNTQLKRPTAFSEGTALVAYSPAIMTDSLTISFELAVASFPQDFLSFLSTAFNTLSGIPLLLPHTGFLLGAGALFKIIGNVGHALFDGVRFSVTDSIDFNLPGGTSAAADFRVLAGSGFDLEGYHYIEGRGLLDPKGNVYAGNHPYVVMSLDGAQRDELKKFVPAVASAAVLQRFFQVQDGAQVSIDAVVQGLQLASDLKYREQAISLNAQLATATTPEEKTKIQEKLDAAKKNISTDVLVPA